jgi:hypothetical protein
MPAPEGTMVPINFFICNAAAATGVVLISAGGGFL